LSIAARDHTPAVAVEGERNAGAETRFLFHREMRVEQESLAPASASCVAVGMAPAACTNARPLESAISAGTVRLRKSAGGTKSASNTAT
jgi:hypothetical protein